MIIISSKTKVWTVEDFRRELKKIDDYVFETQGIELAGAEFEIKINDRMEKIYGLCDCVNMRFTFSSRFFNSDIPESCAIDVIRHEYAHYYAYAVFGDFCHHNWKFKKACLIVGATPQSCYTQAYKNREREKERKANLTFESTTRKGKMVKHPEYGFGVIQEVKNTKTTAILTVKFEGGVIKKVDEKWLRKNGKIFLGP
ncbi:MAG: SprT-like domain-containing protein [Clostridia bacterium]|nr:SprT-like domain-containing protein [Clostridia bacterium]